MAKCIAGTSYIVKHSDYFRGFVSGMKSALNYPTWPTMNGEWIPAIILDKNQWNATNFFSTTKQHLCQHW